MSARRRRTHGRRPYEPSPEEISNFVWIVLHAAAEWPMRAADLAVVTLLAGPLRGPEGLQRLLETTCEYLWDHILGESDGVDVSEIVKHASHALSIWYAVSDRPARERFEQ